jgi:hypothetical protein
MTKPPYTVFEAVGFTEPIPGLRRRPVAARSAPIVELVEGGDPRWSATLPPDEAPAGVSAPAARSRAAPLATGAVLLAMAGAGWATLQASSTPALEIPPITELAAPAPLPSEALNAQATPPAALTEPATEEAVDQSESKPISPPAAPTKTAAVKPNKGDLLQSLPPPAAGQVSKTLPSELPPLPSSMPTSPLALPAAAPASAASAPKPESKPETEPETPALEAPQPPASAASSS